MTRYHPLLVILHWLLAVLVVGGLIMGATVLAATPNTDPFKITALTMHMTMGLLILALMVVRVVVRLSTAKPPPADIGLPLVNRASVWAHWAFYGLVGALSLSGVAMASLADLPAIVFGGTGDPLPASFDDLPPRAVHGALATLLMVLIGVHAAAALYHQYARRDRLFSRMWFGQRDA